MVPSNPGVGTSLRTKLFFSLFSICTVKLLATQKIIAFLSQSKFECEKGERESNLILYNKNICLDDHFS